MKLFGKYKKSEFGDADLPRVCRFCERAALINDDENVLCSERGIVSSEYCCRKYSYDPLKRAPKIPPAPPKFDPDEIAAEMPAFLFGGAPPTPESEDAESHAQPDGEKSGVENEPAEPAGT